MSVTIKRKEAAGVLLEAASRASRDEVSAPWEAKVRSLSKICEAAPRTHIAFLGTVLLAKATNPDIDVYALHVKHGTVGAYSARSLAQHVLVPHSRKLEIHLGVTGREPLNNQPYFRPHAVSRDMIVHANAAEALERVCDCLDELTSLTPEEALAALAAYVKVRQEYWVAAPPYIGPGSAIAVSDLIKRVDEFVGASSEGGKRAQAVATGLMDVVEKPKHVVTGRINDPSRRCPGDVVVNNVDGQPTRTIEVRDKPVSGSDVTGFVTKVAMAGVPRAGVLAVSPQQSALDVDRLTSDAAALGVNLQIFEGWASYCRQILFWLPGDAPEPSQAAHERIYERLGELECSTEALEWWLKWKS